MFNCADDQIFSAGGRSLGRSEVVDQHLVELGRFFQVYRVRAFGKDRQARIRDAPPQFFDLRPWIGAITIPSDYQRLAPQIGKCVFA